MLVLTVTNKTLRRLSSMLWFTHLLVVDSFTYLHLLPGLGLAVAVTPRPGRAPVVLVLLACLLHREAHLDREYHKYFLGFGSAAAHPVLVAGVLLVLLPHQPRAAPHPAPGLGLRLLDRNVISVVPSATRSSGSLALLPGGVDDGCIRNAST